MRTSRSRAPPPNFLRTGSIAVCFGEEFGFVLVEFELRFIQVGHVDDLHLPDHERIGGGGCESAAGTGEFCHEGCARHNGGLFDHHRDKHIACR